MLPKLEVIRLSGVKLCSPSQEADEEPQPVDEKIKTEVTTTVLSLHEKIEHLQTVIQLQRLRCVFHLTSVVMENLQATINAFSPIHLQQKTRLDQLLNIDCISL